MAEDVAFVGELEDFDDDEPLLSLVGILNYEYKLFNQSLLWFEQHLIYIELLINLKSW